MNKKINFMVLYFVIAFVVSQLTTFFLSKENFLVSPSFILLPIAGFFSVYLFAPAIIKDLKIKKLAFVISFVVLSLLGYYFALFFYNYNIYVILNDAPIKIEYFKLLLESGFFSFVVAGTIGAIFSRK
jgi:hypothetical protein